MLYQLDDVERLLAEGPGLHVRFSRGFAADLEDGGIDGETGLELPGYAARPLDPEPWWTLPTVDWIARQLSRDPAHVCKGTEQTHAELGFRAMPRPRRPIAR